MSVQSNKQGERERGIEESLFTFAGKEEKARKAGRRQAVALFDVRQLAAAAAAAAREKDRHEEK